MVSFSKKSLGIRNASPVMNVNSNWLEVRFWCEMTEPIVEIVLQINSHTNVSHAPSQSLEPVRNNFIFLILK